MKNMEWCVLEISSHPRRHLDNPFFTTLMFDQFAKEFFKEVPSKAWIILSLSLVNAILLGGVAWFATQEVYTRLVG